MAKEALGHFAKQSQFFRKLKKQRHIYRCDDLFSEEEPNPNRRRRLPLSWGAGNPTCSRLSGGVIRAKEAA